MAYELEVKDLHASIDGKQILKGVNFKVKEGEIHAIMGPNGSGKSTLAYAIMGHPRYKIDSGNIVLNGESMVGLSADKRARKGLFLAFQYPITVSGVNLTSFLRSSYDAIRSPDGAPGKGGVPFVQFKRILDQKLDLLQIDPSFAGRYLNEGFSGGEKKKCEILQMAMLQPRIAVLDETDTGLDIDALKVVAEGVNKLAGPDLGVAIITHYQRILRYISPQFVHVMFDGKIAHSGGKELAEQLEEKGYGWLRAGA
ncbi:MAG: Fe-S cluster assembly ATPase SufC [Thaumarchaeota archaeon]|nr:Fe-S cluster assembly ATPase SufC [Nitrososphaerota archaeon]